MATTKETLQELIKRLNEKEAQEVLEYTRWLLAEKDTNPLTDDERKAIDAGRAARARGEGDDWDQVRSFF